MIQMRMGDEIIFDVAAQHRCYRCRKNAIGYGLANTRVKCPRVQTEIVPAITRSHQVRRKIAFIEAAAYTQGDDRKSGLRGRGTRWARLRSRGKSEAEGEEDQAETAKGLHAVKINYLCFMAKEHHYSTQLHWTG